MTLAPFVQTLGRGPGRSRSLTQAEAHAAMTVMLSGRAAPEAIGAILMLLRMKGETADEIAGFAAAAVDSLPPIARPALDWPSYAAGRTRGLPWFLLAARLVAGAGHPVLLHGWNGAGQGAMQAALSAAEIPVCRTSDGIDVALDRQQIAYVGLQDLSPALFALLTLRDVLGLRSCINTVSRMLNPGRAGASVQGVFHPSYRLLQADAAQRLGWQSLTVIKGGGGEFERHPAKDAHAFGLRHGAPWDDSTPAQVSDTRRLDDGQTDPARLAALWSGTLHDPFAEAIVISTAALALDTLGDPTPDMTALDLWTRRHSLKAA